MKRDERDRNEFRIGKKGAGRGPFGYKITRFSFLKNWCNDEWGSMVRPTSLSQFLHRSGCLCPLGTDVFSTGRVRVTWWFWLTAGKHVRSALLITSDLVASRFSATPLRVTKSYLAKTTTVHPYIYQLCTAASYSSPAGIKIALLVRVFFASN